MALVLARAGKLLEPDLLVVGTSVLSEPVQQHDRRGTAAAAGRPFQQHHRSGLLQAVGGNAVAHRRNEPVGQA